MGGEVTGVPEVENEPRDPGLGTGLATVVHFRGQSAGADVFVCMCPQDPYQNQGQDGGPATVGPQGGIC